MTVWFTSDTHFGHLKVARDRGFGTVSGHDEYLIREWNKLVRPDDQVWHLGDVGMVADRASLDALKAQGMSSTDYILGCVDRLNGTKILVAGNHDAPHPMHRDAHRHQQRWMWTFDAVQAFAKRRFGGHTVLLSHFPYNGDHTDVERCTQYRLRDEGLPVLHGHIHSSEKVSGPRQIHVGVDGWDLRPASLDEVMKLL